MNTNPQRFSGEWETKRLEEIGTFSKGRGIKRDDVTDEGIPCVRYGELYTRYQDYILKASSRIPPDTAATALPIQKGDLLFAGSGETAEEIGRCAAYLGEEQAYAGGDVIVLTPSGQNPIYLGHLMNSPMVSEQKARLGQGDAVVHIYINNLAQVQIELPSIREQNAIAEVLSDVDGLRNALEALIAKKRAIKQATMQQLLTGKTRLPGFNGAWETKQLGDVSNIDPENLSSGTNPNYVFNYISLEQVDSGKLLGYSEEVFRIAPSRAKRVLRDGDVLMSTVRPNLMAHFLFRNQISNAVCSTGFAVLRAKRDLSIPYFLFAQLFSKGVNDQITKILAGSNYPAINSRDVKLIEIPCPPQISEQRAIGAVLSDMDAEIAALEQRRDKTRAIKQGMMQQLLTGRVRLSESRIVADDTDDAD